MIKKVLNILIIIICISSNSYSSNDVRIIIAVDNEIITNYDLQKEMEYLKILNPKLSQLDNIKINDIAKNSLVKEIIKKKEIEKIFDLQKELLLVNKVFKELYTGINFKNENEFMKTLSYGENYSINEIKEKLKIELFWNEIIYKKYNNQVKINENNLLKKINNKNSGLKTEYLLSEIFFKKDKDKKLKTQIQEIKKSINEVGFSNTASIFSISESSNYGGKIGWIFEDNLSKDILYELKKISENEHTNVIQIGGSFLILKIEKKKIKKIKIDKKKQLKEMKIFEKNRQLRQFSSIYFNKVKINYSVNEN